MTPPTTAPLTAPPLRCGVVLRVQEQACEVLAGGELSTVSFAPSFPSPRIERVSPGHLVALAPTSGGTDAVIWRWYDAVVLGEEDGLVRLWEPTHGEVLARSRHPGTSRVAGSRAYASAGLPGADWWVAGAANVPAREADVDLDEVARFWTEHDLWGTLQ